MSLATIHNVNGAIGNGDVARSETIATVSIICLLASAPLVVAIALMVWGG
jgi:hypothetical protein